MEINVSVHQADEPVAVIHIRGIIDASNFLDLVTKAQEIYENPARNLIIDLSEVPYVSSAGLAAIHKIALLYRDIPEEVEENTPPDSVHGSTTRKRVKLLSPQPLVDQIFETSGLKLFFKVFNDLESAIRSF